MPMTNFHIFNGRSVLAAKMVASQTLQLWLGDTNEVVYCSPVHEFKIELNKLAFCVVVTPQNRLYLEGESVFGWIQFNDKPSIEVIVPRKLTPYVIRQSNYSFDKVGDIVMVDESLTRDGVIYADRSPNECLAKIAGGGMQEFWPYQIADLAEVEL